MGVRFKDGTEDFLWTKKEVAAFYQVTERTVDRWIASQTIPAVAKVTIGGRVRFRSKTLIDAITGEEASDGEMKETLSNRGWRARGPPSPEIAARIATIIMSM
jgi:hypothetical protein